TCTSAHIAPFPARRSSDLRPGQLSGGQQQRVGIARAIVTDPTLIVADEPTGDLDSKSAREILDLLSTLREHLNKTIIMVTHDPRSEEHMSELQSPDHLVCR